MRELLNDCGMEMGGRVNLLRSAAIRIGWECGARVCRRGIEKKGNSIQVYFGVSTDGVSFELEAFFLSLPFRENDGILKRRFLRPVLDPSTLCCGTDIRSCLMLAISILSGHQWSSKFRVGFTTCWTYTVRKRATSWKSNLPVQHQHWYPNGHTRAQSLRFVLGLERSKQRTLSFNS